MKKILCDKCGKEIETKIVQFPPSFYIIKDHKVIFQKIVSGGTFNTDQYFQFDLCEKCYVKALELFQKWLNEKKMDI